MNRKDNLSIGAQPPSITNKCAKMKKLVTSFGGRGLYRVKQRYDMSEVAQHDDSRVRNFNRFRCSFAHTLEKQAIVDRFRRCLHENEYDKLKKSL